MVGSTSSEHNIPLMIYDLIQARVKCLLASWGEKNFRADQIWQGLYKHFWQSPEQFTTLSKFTRQKLTENVRFTSLEPVRELSAKDGNTIKTLFPFDRWFGH